LFLSSNKDGEVYCHNQKKTILLNNNNDNETIWNIEKINIRVANNNSNNSSGLIIRSVASQRMLVFNKEDEIFCTIPKTNEIDEKYCCIWDFESLHRQVYYLISNNKKRLNAAVTKNKNDIITTRRNLLNRISSEEWKICPIKQNGVVVRLFSSIRQQYLSSNSLGEIFLTSKEDNDCDDLVFITSEEKVMEDEWLMEQQNDGTILLRSHATRRILVIASSKSGGDGPFVTTINQDVINYDENLIVDTCCWKLEPKIPRRVSKDKIITLGGAVAIGIVGTVATPFLLGGAIGALGIAQAGLMGHVAIGSVKAVETISTVRRVTLSSAQLLTKNAKSTSSPANSSSSNNKQDNEEEEEEEETKHQSNDDDSNNDNDKGNYNNRPFYAWRSW